LNKSLHTQIFISFFFVALIPFYLLLYYTYTQSREQLINKVELQHQKNLDKISLSIQKDIDELNRELSFIASLSLMDDIISEDIDKRLLSLLELKTKVFKLQTNISLYDTNAKRIASASTCKDTKGIMLKKDIFASFNPQMPIGSIHINLPYSSLNYYFDSIESSWCIQQKSTQILNNCTLENSITISKKLGVDNLTLSLLLNKDELFKPLALLEKQLITLALFSFFLFVLLFFIVSKIIAKPIAQNIHLQEQKLHLLEESKHAAETKSRFISQMSHEFRTPLNSIIGFSQFLDQENLVDTDYKKLPTNIEKAGKHLLQMVNQILEFAKADSEHLTLDIQELHVKNLLEEVVSLVQSQADKKSLTLTCRCEDIIIQSDKQMLQNILINLVANAIKFTHSGDIEISVIHDEHIKISVRDSGIGISKEQSALLFKPFERLEGSKEIEGSGLGLALSYAYAQALHVKLYHVAHESGSEFVIEI